MVTGTQLGTLTVSYNDGGSAKVFWSKGFLFQNKLPKA